MDKNYKEVTVLKPLKVISFLQHEKRRSVSRSLLVLGIHQVTTQSVKEVYYEQDRLEYLEQGLTWVVRIFFPSHNLCVPVLNEDEALRFKKRIVDAILHGVPEGHLELGLIQVGKEKKKLSTNVVNITKNKHKNKATNE